MTNGQRKEYAALLTQMALRRKSDRNRTVHNMRLFLENNKGMGMGIADAWHWELEPLKPVRDEWDALTKDEWDKVIYTSLSDNWAQVEMLLLAGR